MKNQALQYFMHDGPAAFRFELAGELDGEGARRLEQDWRTASSVIGDRALIVDMTFLTSAEEEGRALLARWHVEGACLVAQSKLSSKLAEEIIGEPVMESTSAGRGWTWLPFRTNFAQSSGMLKKAKTGLLTRAAQNGDCASASVYRAATVRESVTKSLSQHIAKMHMALLPAMLLVPLQLYAAHLKTETVAAWDNYIQSVQAEQQNRIRPGGSFLWTSESPERLAKVHGGEIVVAPAAAQNPVKIPEGLIHHWIGAGFLGNAKLEDVLDVTRDYDGYKAFYRPYVIDSKTVARGDPLRGTPQDDSFSMLLMNQALFVKMALDADYQSTNVRLDDCRFYSVSKTTRVQELEDYGQPGEHELAQGEGGGYIWKLFSVIRLEQRDGGVYIEMETVALSREIPNVVRLVVNPIVRRVSRNAMLTSIQQTEQAVRGSSLVARKPADSSVSAEQAGSSSAALKNKTSAFARVQ